MCRSLVKNFVTYEIPLKNSHIQIRNLVVLILIIASLEPVLILRLQNAKDFKFLFIQIILYALDVIYIIKLI